MLQHLRRITLFLTSAGLLAACSSAPAPVPPPAVAERPVDHFPSTATCQMVKPDYPGNGRFRGVVTLGFEVSAAGEIENITMIESSGHQQLDDSAMHALQLSHCKPYLRKGQPIRAHYTVPYAFEASARPAPAAYSEASKAALDLLPGASPDEGVGRTYHVDVPRCDVRRAPDQKARVLGTYARDRPLTIYERRHEFARVSPDGAAPEWVVFALLRP